MKQVARLRKDSKASLDFSRSDLVLPKAIVRLEIATCFLLCNIKNVMSPILLDIHVEMPMGKEFTNAIAPRISIYSRKLQSGNAPTNFRLSNLAQFIGMA